MLTAGTPCDALATA